MRALITFGLVVVGIVALTAGMSGGEAAGDDAPEIARLKAEIEQLRGRGREQVEQAEAGRRLFAHHHGALEADATAAAIHRGVGSETDAERLIDLRGERLRIEGVPQHRETVDAKSFDGPFVDREVRHGPLISQ